jgi:hypothetical protein
MIISVRYVGYITNFPVIERKLEMLVEEWMKGKFIDEM